MQRQVGDIVRLEGIGDFEQGVRCVVIELSEDGSIKKMKALEPDERLGKIGFIEEGGDYYAVEWQFCNN